MSRKMDLFRSVSFSVKTTVNRVQDTGSDIKRQLEDKAKNSKWFLLALNMLTDIYNTEQAKKFSRM